MNKSVLLIGGSGFLGSAMRRAFAEDGRYEVFFSSTHGDPDDPHHFALDLLRQEDLRIVSDMDVIVNMTGQVTNPLTTCFRLNTAGIDHLISSIRHDRQLLVHISTTHVYGSVPIATESSPVDPETPYAACKATADYLLQTGVPLQRCLIARLSSLYGPGQTKGLLWYLIEKIKKNEEIVITDNNGELRRHFLHVDDAAKTLHWLIDARATGIVNVPGFDCYSIRELVTLCEKILKRSLPATYAAAVPTEIVGKISAAVLEQYGSLPYGNSVEEYLRQVLL